MSRLSRVYDGKEADKMTRDELINAILNEYIPGIFTKSVPETEKEKAFYNGLIQAMTEAFRCGFLRGEEYAK